MSTLNSILGNPSLVTFSMYPLSEAAGLLSCTQEDINVVASNGLIKLCVKVPEDVITVLTVKRQDSSPWSKDFYEPMPDIEYLELSYVQCKTFAINEYINARRFDEKGFEYRHPTFIKSRKVSQFEAEQCYPIIPKDYYYYIFVEKALKAENYDSLTVQLFSNERTFLLKELYIGSDQLKKLDDLLLSEWANEQRELGCLSPLPSAPAAPEHNDETPKPAYDVKPRTDFYCKNFPSSFTPHVNIPESLIELANLTDRVRCLVENNQFNPTKLHDLFGNFFKGYSKNDKDTLKAIVCPLAFRPNNVNEQWSHEQRESISHLTPEVLAAFDVSEKFWSTFNKNNIDDSESYPDKQLIIDFLKKAHHISSKNRAELIEKIARTAKRPAGRPKTRKQ